MKVAVLIPLHNHARFIGAAVASLRAQSRPPDRIIVIDDGSTDGSLNALMAVAEEPVPAPARSGAILAKGKRMADTEPIETRTDVIIESTAGLYATLNRAVALADDCDFLAILRSEDCYHPRRIERCLAYLEDHPDVDLICTRLRLIDDNGDTLSAESPLARWMAAAWSYSASIEDNDPPHFAEWLGLANFAGTTSNFFARASYLREHPFQNYPLAYDYQALVVAALEHKLGVIDAELLDHRVQQSETADAVPDANVRELLRMNVDLMREIADRLPREPTLRATFGRYLRGLWSNISGVRADLLNVVLCEALMLSSTAGVNSLIEELDRARFPEVSEYPNRSVAGAYGSGSVALGVPSGLADRFLQLKARLSSVRADARPWMEFRQLQEALLASRWYALGRLLGRAHAVSRAGGQTAPEKLTVLRERIASSRWLQLGHRLGVSSATRLLALSRSSAQVD